jgi:hypothetical protein
MRKTMCFAVFAAAVLAGCGGEGVRPAASLAAQPVTSEEASANLWAENAFGIYGRNAVDSCLAGFQVENREFNGAADEYRAHLADYMCACARGQSKLPCPKP